MFPPERAREKLPLVCTDSLIVLTAASAARRLSSFTSANTRTSGFMPPRPLVPKVRTVPALHNNQTTYAS